MELGGHAPVLVYDDTDVDYAATTCSNTNLETVARFVFLQQDFMFKKKFTTIFVKNL